MIKAKTKKNMFRILSTILGAVFALITGVTYCAKSLNLQYGLNPNSTSAYLANQQYAIVNDTVQNPILFGEGSHNFEIALQYAFDYNFDVRLKYEMVWSQGITVNSVNSRVATNVILHFAERNNIIYDENYIFVANSVPAGNGKLTIITGVDFVEPTDERYFGQTLQINIIDVKIYKQQDSYDKSSHLLTTQDEDNNTPDVDIDASLAAQAWINYKNRASLTNASVMMYNYRRNYETGVSYPGLNSAYHKTTDSSGKVSAATWLGGNKAYAGTGMYIITGASPIKFQIEVAGIWRDDKGVNITDKAMISENSIKYNYSEDFTHASWDELRLWETRTFNYVVPENSAYYIDILDSVEITSADRNENNLFDSYRLVTNEIKINPGYTETVEGSSFEREVKFTYTESSADFIQIKDITTNSNVSVTNSYANKIDDGIKVVNSSKYLNGLYEARSDVSQQFKTNISLINTTATPKTVTLEYQLNYTLSNGKTVLTNVVNENGVDTYTRAEEYITGGYTKLDAFKSNLYYSYSLESDELSTEVPLIDKVTIAPYSSVTLADSYTVNAGLHQEIVDILDPAGEGGVQADGKTENYDVWTFLDVTPTVVTNETKANLVIEKSISGNTVELSVKNNSKTTITGISISGVEVAELSNATYTVEGGENAPNDWVANYWKYYKRSGTEGNYTYTQLTTQDTYVKDTYYSKSQTYKNLTVTAQNGFVKDANNSSLFTHSTKVLRPGEEVVFGVATTSATKQVYATARAISSSLATENTAMLINAGSLSYIVNNSSTVSYYVRFSGTYVGTDTTNIKQGDYTENQTTVTHNYYIGILRPGQIVVVPLSSIGVMGLTDMVEATSSYSASTLQTAKWSSTIINDLTTLFT